MKDLAGEPTFLPSTGEVEVFDFLDLTIRLHQPVEDPFRSVEVVGIFGGITVRGFCDSQDGSVYRVRFMPLKPGIYSYTITVRYGETESRFEGSVTATDAGRRGLLEVDPEHPFHFRWSGTGEHFFWNATTAYLLAGCSDSAIAGAIDRLADLGVNRLRVALCPSRQANGGRWFEPQVAPREDFTFNFSPWLVRRPDSVTEPEPDVTRFDIAFWQKYERLLLKARERDVIVQVIFFVDAQEPQNYPFNRERLGDDPDERRYYAYAVARLGAFSNVEWCLTNEWRLFRPDAWVEHVGARLEAISPYPHLISVHGHEVFPFRQSSWADFALYQVWDEAGGYGFMRRQREAQAATGRPIPQINEEYGYEDHYPQGWGGARVAPARSAETRRRLAWEIAMAGCYQTTGESAENGCGGWINGVGDASMTLLEGYRPLYEFFAGIAWWRLEPLPEGVFGDGVLALGEAGQQYVFYLPQGGMVRPAVDGYTGPVLAASWYNPRSGERFAAVPGEEGVYRCPGQESEEGQEGEDWVLYLELSRE